MIRRNRIAHERLDLLRDLRRQLPCLTGAARERTVEAIRQVELQAAPGRATADAAQRRLEGFEEVAK